MFKVHTFMLNARKSLRLILEYCLKYTLHYIQATPSPAVWALDGPSLTPGEGATGV